MKYSIKDFLSSKIALDVNKKDRPEFNRLMDEAGMKWACGCKASAHDWFPCWADGKALHGGCGLLPVVNFSDLLPAPAPKQPESAPHPVKVGDRIRILRDRARSADVYKGDEFTVKTVYGIKGKIDVNFDPDWEFLAEDYEIIPPAPSPRIEITVAGRVTTATLYEDGKAVRTGTATCSPEDEFEFETGARIAFNRLIPGTIRELKVRVSMDTSAFDAALQSVRDALKDLPNKVKVEKA